VAVTPGSYLKRVQSETREVVQELAAQTQRLRSLVGNLEIEKQRLHDQVERLRDELLDQEKRGFRLEEELHAIDARNREFLERYDQLEQQNTNLVNLYVASYQLHGTLKRDTVLASIQEIVANLIGCEEMALFEPLEGGDALEPTTGFGIDARCLAPVRPGEGIVGRCVVEGERWVDGSREGALPQEEHLTACVPLVVDGEVVAAVAMFRLLPQKAHGYEEVDHELMGVLATHAAAALLCIRLLEARGRVA